MSPRRGEKKEFSGGIFSILERKEGEGGNARHQPAGIGRMRGEKGALDNTIPARSICAGLGWRGEGKRKRCFVRNGGGGTTAQGVGGGVGAGKRGELTAASRGVGGKGCDGIVSFFLFCKSKKGRCRGLLEDF